MKSCIFLSFVFILIYSKSLAQNSIDSLNNQNTDEYNQTLITNKEGNIGLYFSPFALLDFNPIIYVGIEYFLKENSSIYTDIGYLPRMQNIYRGKFIDGNDTKSSFVNSSYPNFIIKSEIRSYQSYKKRHSRYTAFCFILKNVTYDIENANEYYTSRRTTLGVTFIRGWQRQFTEKTLLNPYVGIGVKVAFTTPSKDLIKDPVFLDFIPSSSLAEKETFPLLDVALGIRFGGKIRRK